MKSSIEWNDGVVMYLSMKYSKKFGHKNNNIYLFVFNENLNY